MINLENRRHFDPLTDTNWRGRPLVDMATVVNLIANTKTATGLTVRCVEDRNVYPTKIKVTAEQFAQVHLQPETFHAEWNYTH
ncbi:MAG: hypothetical protein LBN39_02005 [Planctomycetaceae bacterium]|nr:hypothetical protein [Planctomycetaceae bacterium]